MKKMIVLTMFCILISSTAVYAAQCSSYGDSGSCGAASNDEFYACWWYNADEYFPGSSEVCGMQSASCPLVAAEANCDGEWAQVPEAGCYWDGMCNSCDQLFEGPCGTETFCEWDASAFICKGSLGGTCSALYSDQGSCDFATNNAGLQCEWEFTNSVCQISVAEAMLDCSGLLPHGSSACDKEMVNGFSCFWDEGNPGNECSMCVNFNQGGCDAEPNCQWDAPTTCVGILETVAQAESCDDGIENQDETCIDGGGICGPLCAAGEGCSDTNLDCESGGVAVVCVDNVCSSCTNLVQDGDETDVDCGGTCNSELLLSCILEQTCDADSDCSTSYCREGECRVDCEQHHEDCTSCLAEDSTCDYYTSGGAGYCFYNDFVSGSCDEPRSVDFYITACYESSCSVNVLPANAGCGYQTDACDNNYFNGVYCYTDNICTNQYTPSHCSNGLKDAHIGETDVDCGSGSGCGLCATWESCITIADCSGSDQCDANRQCFSGQNDYESSETTIVTKAGFEVWQSGLSQEYYHSGNTVILGDETGQNIYALIQSWFVDSSETWDLTNVFVSTSSNSLGYEIDWTIPEDVGGIAPLNLDLPINHIVDGLVPVNPNRDPGYAVCCPQGSFSSTCAGLFISREVYYGFDLNKYYVCQNLVGSSGSSQGETNLTINSSVEGTSAVVGAPIEFYAYYFNETNGTALTNTTSNCSGYINSSLRYFDYDSGDTRWEYNYTSGYSTLGIKNWNVTCNTTAAGHYNLSASDTVSVTLVPYSEDQEFNVTVNSTDPRVVDTKCYDSNTGSSLTVTPTAFSTTTVICNATVYDSNGCLDYNSTTPLGEFYYAGGPQCGANNHTDCYNNASCEWTG
ncbi:MAG: hypothetical protein GOV02_03470, partial [Candidatus Aenigmarchaeota archaeon]|nr:hypothetical protein [Candidatus Aenigmarchaeota archaeon]